MAKGNHSFTEQDIHSRFDAVVGHTVAEVDTAGVLAASSASPLDLKEIEMDGLSLHEKCALQLGWELAGEAGGRDRADMSVDELIELGESKAENRELVVWLNGYMDPYEGEIDTAKYSRAEIVDKLLFD